MTIAEFTATAQAIENEDERDAFVQQTHLENAHGNHLAHPIVGDCGFIVRECPQCGFTYVEYEV